MVQLIPINIACRGIYLGKLEYFTEILGHFGMIPRILTMITVRENSEVVVIYPYIYIYTIHGVKLNQQT